MNVKLARIKLGITQKELAKRAGLSNVTLVKIERGHYENVTRSSMIKIAKALNTTPQELFFSDEQ